MHIMKKSIIRQKIIIGSIFLLTIGFILYDIFDYILSGDKMNTLTVTVTAVIVIVWALTGEKTNPPDHF